MISSFAAQSAGIFLNFETCAVGAGQDQHPGGGCGANHVLDMCAAYTSQTFTLGRENRLDCASAPRIGREFLDGDEVSKRMVPAHELSTMKKVRQEIRPFGPARMLTKSAYARVLRPLQIELVKLQKHLIRCNDKLVVVLEGRDASGKDGVIKTMVRHLSPRETRVVALGKPSDRERSAWYFQRYAVHLPAGQEFVLFNRSWYNRAGVERVMKFCSDHEYEEFMRSVLDFERMLISSGIRLFKYYLDITRREQRRRLKERAADPLKQWKVSPIDAEALERWHDYSEARDEMFKRTHDPSTPWTIVRADDKRVARLNLIRDLLSRLQYCDKDDSVLSVDPAVVFRYEPDGPDAGAIAH